MSGLFGGGAPSPKPPAPMPDDQSPAVVQARKTEQERILSRAGRQSTILTRPENRGGGNNFDTFAGKQLGVS